MSLVMMCISTLLDHSGIGEGAGDLKVSNTINSD